MDRQRNVRVQEIYALLLIILLSVLTRLPQLLSSNLLLDSDECIVALMAKHMCRGEGFPVFFYGQSYGFSLVETAVISLFSLPAGMNDIAVKLAMLALWITGVYFFYRSLKEVVTQYKWLPLLVTVLLICCPAWAVWSMKARGGYLTAFMCSTLITWLLLRQSKRGVHYNIAGALLIVTWFSQPLWLPGLVPLLAFAVLRERKRRPWRYFAAGFVPMLIIFIPLKNQADNYWQPDVFRLKWPGAAQVDSMFRLLTDHLNGWYYLDEIFAAPAASRIAAGMMMAVLLIIVAAAIFFNVRCFRRQVLFTASVISVVFTLSYALFLSTEAPRYLLPLSGFALFALALLLDKIGSGKVLLTVCMPAMAAGLCAMYSFHNYAFVPFTEADLQSSIRYLEQHHIRYVFSNDGLLEWQLMYYSNERIICRESSLKDRLPEYVQYVNTAYRNKPQTTAVIDFYGDLPDMAPGKVVMTGGKFAVALQPDMQLLRDMEFEMQ